MQINRLGSNGFMSFQIRLKLRELHADDLVRNGVRPASPPPPPPGGGALACSRITSISMRLMLV